MSFEVGRDELSSLDREGVAHTIYGENGAGKTTFIEHVLIPSLRARKKTILQLGPDDETSTLVIRSWCLFDARGKDYAKLLPKGFRSLVNAAVGSDEIRFIEENVDFDVVVIDDYGHSIATILPAFSERAYRSKAWYFASHDHQNNESAYSPFSEVAKYRVNKHNRLATLSIVSEVS